MDSLGGTREAPGRQDRINWTACEEAPGRQERAIWTAWEAPGKLVAQDCRSNPGFGKGAGFCITSIAFSMAIGPVRGKSWGELYGWLPVAQPGL